MLRSIIHSTFTLFTQILFYNLIQAQILLAAHEDIISSADGGASQHTSTSLLACLHSTSTGESESQKEGCSEFFGSEQGICRIIEYYQNISKRVVPFLCYSYDRRV